MAADRLPEKIDSKFRYVLLASSRAEQMMRGSQPKVPPQNQKLTRVALEEIAEDLVTWDYGPEEIPVEAEAVDGETPAFGEPPADDEIPT